MNEEVPYELITIPEFKEFMYRSLIPISDIFDHNNDPIQKILPFWRRHKILPFKAVGKHWEEDFELTFIQLIWLRIVDSLRQLNYPLIHIKNLCEYFFKDSWDDDLPMKILLRDKFLYENKASKEALNDQEKLILNRINQCLENKDARTMMFYLHNYLSELIAASLNERKDAGILLYPDGQIIEYVGNKYFNHKDQKINYANSAPHIQLSINYFLQEFIDNDQLQKIVVPKIINDDERTVLEALRDKNIEELIIKKDGETILRIDSSMSSSITGEKAIQLRKILGLRNYEEIEISTRDEKTLKFKKKTKSIISNYK